MNKQEEAHYKQRVLDLGQALAEHSSGRLVVLNDGGNHFITLDECNIGRSFETYGFMAHISSWEFTLTKILEEVLIPIRQQCPASYRAAAAILKELGAIYPPELRAEWETVLQ